MALLKAFVCQVILLGLYKLFLEQVVEEYLVPDELTRNCLVGFVCLLCFGIQLYTDKAGDDENAEADENPKEKSNSRGAAGAKKSESAEISANHETVRSNTSSRVMATKPQNASREIAPEKKMSPNDKQVGDLRERSSAVSPNEAVKVAEVAHSGIFAHFPPNMSNTIPNVIKADGMGEPEVPVSTAQTSYEKETKTTIPVLNRLSETNISEESDEDDIEIDQCATKESSKEEAKKLTTVEAEDVEPIKANDGTEEGKQSRTIEAEEIEPIKPEDVTEECKQLRTVEAEPIKPEDVTEECKQLRRVEAEPIKPQDGIEEGKQSRTIEAEKMEPIKPEDVTEECKQLRTVEAEPIKPEDVTEECKQLTTVEAEPIKPEDVTEEGRQLRTVEAEEFEVIKHENVTEAVVESECLTVDGEDISSTQDSDKTTALKNGIAEESLNNIDNISSNIIEEIESKKSVEEEGEIGNGQEMTLSSEPDEHTKDISESLPSAQEMSNTSSKALNDVETMNKNNTETSTLVKTAVSSPSEKLTVARQNVTAAGDVCVAPVTIDISFIYACH